MEISIEFFKTVQNKMHWAITGQTAAEIIHSRADVVKPNMGLTNYLDAKGRRKFWRRYLAPLTEKRLSKTLAANLDRIPNLAPSDFKIVRDRSRLLPNDPVTNLDLIQALAEESQHKKQGRTQSIGFSIK